MDQQNSASPLRRFLDDDRLRMMEEVIPYCAPALGKAIALEMKCFEIQKILQGFDDAERLQACGFEEKPQDVESVLQALQTSVSPGQAEQIGQLLSMLRFSRMYQTYAAFLKEHPELNRAQADAGSGSHGSDPFQNPGLLMLLNSAMNAGGDTAGTLKKALDLAGKSGGENQNPGDLLSLLLKSQQT